MNLFKRINNWLLTATIAELSAVTYLVAMFALVSFIWVLMSLK